MWTLSRTFILPLPMPLSLDLPNQHDLGQVLGIPDITVGEHLAPFHEKCVARRRIKFA